MHEDSCEIHSFTTLSFRVLPFSCPDAVYPSAGSPLGRSSCSATPSIVHFFIRCASQLKSSFPIITLCIRYAVSFTYLCITCTDFHPSLVYPTSHACQPHHVGIEDSHALSSLIEQHPAGLPRSELADCFFEADACIDNLLSQRPHVLLARFNSEKKQDIIYPFKPQSAPPFDAELLSLWSELQLPVDGMRRHLSHNHVANHLSDCFIFSFNSTPAS